MDTSDQRAKGIRTEQVVPPRHLPFDTCLHTLPAVSAPIVTTTYASRKIPRRFSWSDSVANNRPDARRPCIPRQQDGTAVVRHFFTGPGRGRLGTFSLAHPRFPLRRRYQLPVGQRVGKDHDRVRRDRECRCFRIERDRVEAPIPRRGDGLEPTNPASLEIGRLEGRRADQLRRSLGSFSQMTIEYFGFVPPVPAGNLST